VSFPYYSNVGIRHSFQFEINLWAYLEGPEGVDPPVFKDLGEHSIAYIVPYTRRQHIRQWGLTITQTA